MGFSPLADMSQRIPDGGRSWERSGAITGFTIHHQAGVDIHSEAWNPARVVSANYWITNSGKILPNIDENRRAWTTGDANYPAGAESDMRNITVEVSNTPEGVRTGTWAISDAAMKSLIALIADVFKRHNLGAVRRRLYGGVAVHQDFVPTACPGPYIMARLGTIISEAEKLRTASNKPSGKVPKMNYVSLWRTKGSAGKSSNLSANPGKGEQKLAPGGPRHLHVNNKQEPTILFGRANVNVFGSVHLRGKPGDLFTFGAIRGTWTEKGGWKETAYLESVQGVIDANGLGKVSLGIANVLPSGERLRFYAYPLGKNEMIVERYSVKGHIW